eukprot:XP_019079765.1 PREDICTED: TMV resistance protein N-like [Vitis vinifera]
MTSTNTQIISYSPSSSSKSTHQFTYEVFLSFRGEDTRYGFTDHLYEALISCGIRTFRDDEELARGGIIASELLEAIEESKIFVIIFSENYAASRWCLDELVKISECGATEGRRILPIFYHVDPSHVRKQRGSYEKAFVDHEKEADEEKREKIQKWRSALAKVGNLAGYDLQKYQYEARLIKEIIDVILKELNSKLLLHVSKNIVGMNFHLEKLKSLIKIESNDVRMIGIYGLGGIGKTTIAKVVYNNISHQFESRIFLENVRERSKDYSSLLQLQKELLNGVMKGKNKKISNVHEGINVIRNRFHSKKVLLILDDVDNLKQLQFLAGEHSWFGPRSRIIITSRDQHCLNVHGVDASYKVEALSYKESIQLFCQHAFKQNIPKSDYVNLSDHVVNYVKGLPLALEVLGSFLFYKSVPEWESALQKLKENPNIEVQNVLKISFDGLDKKEQEIFLDIVCFFKGWNENDVTRLVKHARIGIRVLSDKCLITLCGNTITIHDLVEEMGREIVRHKHPEEPGKWSRLWDPKDISLVLRKKMYLEELKILNLSESQQLNEIPHFSNMSNLEQLNVKGCRSLDNVDSSVGFLKKLTLLNLRGCQKIRSLPSTIQNLVSLKSLYIDGTAIEELPSSICHLTSLQVLSISECKNLRSLPSSICRLKYLEELNLYDCSNLETFPEIMEDMECLKSLDLSGTCIKELPSSIEFLKHLVDLRLVKCENLRSLPSSICRLKYLKGLNLFDCPNFETFPEIMEDMESLQELDLSGTCIKELPSSIEFLKHLVDLQLVKCENLRSLPSSICRLKYLEKLNLSDCSNLETFPKIMEDMECLKLLVLSGTCIKELPSSIEFLKHLTDLRLVKCENLRSLPSSICRLKYLEELNLYDCSNLENFPEIMEDMECLYLLNLSGTCIKELPSSIEFLKHLTYLRLVKCENLRSLPSSICRLKYLEKLDLYDCSNLETFPEIMEDMESLQELDLGGTCIKELPSSIGYLNHLIHLHLSHCKNLRSLPSNIGRLKLLQKVCLGGCPNLVTEGIENLINLGLLETQYLMDGVTLSDLRCLSLLKRLDLSQNNMRHIPTAITQLCNLRCLNISHCKMLEEIPELPSSLREINAHDCPIFGTLSNPSTLLWYFLLKWFKKIEPPLKWRSINLGSNGIPRWVLHQEMGRQIRIELPMNWYEDDHFLGFGFFCLHYQSNKIYLSLKFDEGEYPYLALEIIKSECDEINDSESDQVLLVYYPKISFRDNEFHSNQYMHLQASFATYDRESKIKSCGVHLIYSQDNQQNHILPVDFLGTQDGEDNRSTTTAMKRSRDDTEHNQAEEPHHKRSREPNTHLKL